MRLFEKFLHRGARFGEGESRGQEFAGNGFRMPGVAFDDLFEMKEAFQVHGQKVDGHLIGPHPDHLSFDDCLDIRGQADDDLTADFLPQQRVKRAGQSLETEIAAGHPNLLAVHHQGYPEPDRDPPPPASLWGVV
jgi:hypothetical protein